MQVPFDFAQGRLSTPLKYASHRMTGHFLIGTLETGHWTPVLEILIGNDEGRMQILRLTTPKLKDVWGPVRSE